MERSLIMLIGASGSGKTTLGKNMVEQLQTEMSIEHISTGNLVRHIGSGAVKSTLYQHILNHLNGPEPAKRLDDEVMYTIISEALIRAEETDIVLLDGAPRTAAQVDDISELALKDSRRVAGAIQTYVASPETNIARLLKRSPREFSRQLTDDEAVEQLHYTNSTLDAVISELFHNAVSTRYLETSGPKADTTKEGIVLVRRIL